MADKYAGLHKGFDGVKSGGGSQKSPKPDIMTGRHVIDPVSGRPLQKGRPIPNAGPSKPPASVVPDPSRSMPKDRLAYHRNPHVAVAPNTPGNRAAGSVGRAVDSTGRIMEGVGSDVMRKGDPSETPYSGDTRSKIELGVGRLADTVNGMDDTLMGRRKKGK